MAKVATKKKKVKKGPTPWDMIKSINEKNYKEDIKAFSPHLTAMSYSTDAEYCFLANNFKLGTHILPNRLFYDFYYHTIKKNRKYRAFPKSAKQAKELQYMQEYFNVDEHSAKTYLEVISEEELKKVKRYFENRGFK